MQSVKYLIRAKAAYGTYLVRSHAIREQCPTLTRSVWSLVLILGYRQVWLRHLFLVQTFGGSNPSTPNLFKLRILRLCTRSGIN